MESTTLASASDAELILKLYDLRREAVMRAARHWIMVEFQPKTAEDILAVYRDFGSQHNQYLRQVIGYWEMAASFVLRGAVDGDLLIESTAENTFILAKFHPFLAEVRASRPNLLIRTEQVMQKYPAARANFEQALKLQEEHRQAAS